MRACVFVVPIVFIVCLDFFFVVVVRVIILVVFFSSVSKTTSSSSLSSSSSSASWSIFHASPSFFLVALVVDLVVFSVVVLLFVVVFLFVAVVVSVVNYSQKCQAMPDDAQLFGALKVGLRSQAMLFFLVLKFFLYSDDDCLTHVIGPRSTVVKLQAQNPEVQGSSCGG